MKKYLQVVIIIYNSSKSILYHLKFIISVVSRILIFEHPRYCTIYCTISHLGEKMNNSSSLSTFIIFTSKNCDSFTTCMSCLMSLYVFELIWNRSLLKRSRFLGYRLNFCQKGNESI